MPEYEGVVVQSASPKCNDTKATIAIGLLFGHKGESIKYPEFRAHQQRILRLAECGLEGSIGAPLILMSIDQRAYDLGPAGHLHFLKDILQVGLHGLFADVQCAGNASIGQAVKEKRDYFSLPFRKRALQLRKLRVQVRPQEGRVSNELLEELPFSPNASRMDGPNRLYDVS